jgi:hypothetical protein
MCSGSTTDVEKDIMGAGKAKGQCLITASICAEIEHEASRQVEDPDTVSCAGYHFPWREELLDPLGNSP